MIGLLIAAAAYLWKGIAPGVFCLVAAGCAAVIFWTPVGKRLGWPPRGRKSARPAYVRRTSEPENPFRRKAIEHLEAFEQGRDRQQSATAHAHEASPPNTQDRLVESLKLKLKNGEALAQRLDQVLPDLIVVKLAIGWHDQVYKMLNEGHRAAAERFLDTEAIVEVPTLSLSSVNPAHLIMEEQLECLRETISQLEASR